MRRRCPAVAGFLVAFLMARVSVAAPRTGAGVGGAATRAHARLGAGTVGRAADQKPTLGDLDTFVDQIMKDWKVPGLAVAVVQDGKVIFSKGYGYRDVDKKLPVTTGTLFAIGSITKSRSEERRVGEECRSRWWPD